VPCACPHCGHSHTRKDRATYFWINITHNLNKMFEAAGLYEILWHGTGLRAGDVLSKLEIGLADMRARPEFYEQFNAENGWGLYKHAVPWLKKVIEACRTYLDAVLECST
jgi:hypothetical protein